MGKDARLKKMRTVIRSGTVGPDAAIALLSGAGPTRTRWERKELDRLVATKRLADGPPTHVSATSVSQEVARRLVSRLEADIGRRILRADESGGDMRVVFRDGGRERCRVDWDSGEVSREAETRPAGGGA